MTNNDEQYILIPADGGEPSIIDEPATVHIKRSWAHPRYGRKVGIDLPPPWEDDRGTKDVFKKELDWDRTHRAWNDAATEWEADFDELNHIIDTMVAKGFNVSVDLRVARRFDEKYVFQPQHRGTSGQQKPA